MTPIDKEALETYLMDSASPEEIPDDCVIAILRILKEFPGIDIKCDAKGVVHGQLTFYDL